MMNKKRLTYASLIGVASVLACVVQAQMSVPSEWDVKPWTTGALFESFNGAKPSWANSEALLAGQPSRTDYRFWTNTVPVGNVLSFATLGITNTFSDAKIQPGVPIFIDMRCKLNPFDTTPPPMDPNTILCFYANEKSNLVVASSSGGTKTNTAITVLPTEYYPIMIRFATDTFDVFFTNSAMPVLSLNASTNEISKMVISGAGEMDDLYVSYGDPRRSSTNSVAVLTPAASTEEEKVVANWLANKMLTGTYTSENATKFYLTDTTPATEEFLGDLGIASISYNPSTLKVTVVVTLKTDATTRKAGKINGLLKLKGAADYETAKAGTWTTISHVAKIGADDFSNGLATYTFTLPNDTYKFFRPVIVSDIK